MTPEELAEIEERLDSCAPGDVSDGDFWDVIAALRKAWDELGMLRLVRETETVGGYAWEAGYNAARAELDDIKRHLQPVFEAGREAGREECAKLIENYEYDTDGSPWSPEAGKALFAEAIRAREK